MDVTKAKVYIRFRRLIAKQVSLTKEGPSRSARLASGLFPGGRLLNPLRDTIREGIEPSTESPAIANVDEIVCAKCQARTRRAQRRRCLRQSP